MTDPAVDDALARCERTLPVVFAWLCRLVGPSRAVDVIPLVYDATAERCDGGAGDAGQCPSEIDLLLARSFRLAGADSVSTASQSDAAGSDDLSVLERAVIDLHAVQRRGVDDTARILGVAAADVADIADHATAHAASAHPQVALGEIGRMREVWLDDEIRERCRAAVAGRDRSDGTADASELDGSTRRRRRIAAVCAAVVVLAVGVVWVRSGDGAGSGEATSSVPSVDAEVVPGSVLGRPPAGFEPVGAVVQPAASPSAAAPAALELWATPDAGRTEGRWFVVMLARCASIDPTVTADASRVEVNGYGGLVIAEVDGVLDLRVQVGSNELTSVTLTVKAFGLTRRELTAVASSVLLRSNVKDPTELAEPSCDAGRPDTTLEFDGTFGPLHEGMERMVSTRWFAGSVMSPDHDGSARRIVEYAAAPGSTDDPATIVVSTTERDATAGSGAERAALVRFLQPASGGAQVPDAVRTIDVDGLAVTMSATVDALGASTGNRLDWTVGAGTITVTSARPVDELLDLVASVRRATDDEWIDLLAAGDDAVPPIGVDRVAGPAPTAAPLDAGGSATTENGITWQLLVGHDPDVLQLGVPERGTVFQAPFQPGIGAPVYTFLAVDTTVVVVRVVDSDAALFVRVTVDGEALAPSPFAPVSGGDAFSMVAFNAPGPYIVELVDAGGVRYKQLASTG